jgi:hypothetical protein
MRSWSLVTVSVHDNWLYAHAVDHQRRRVVLHTVFTHVEPWEYTDVVFTGVVAHHFERQQFGGGEAPANVLFDVEEVSDLLGLLREYEELLRRTKGWGWPTLEYEGLDDLVAQVARAGARCFAVVGTWGLHGFVFARSMELRLRASGARASVAD